MARTKRKENDSKRPTIYDLAKVAEVSPGTVSRVLNNRDKVHPETRKRVLALAQEIGLKPQASVRTREIAIVTDPSFPDRHAGYSANIAGNLSFALSEKGVGVLLPADPERQLSSYFLDGIVAITYGETLLKMLKGIESRIPLVYIDYFGDDKGRCIVNSDHQASGYLAAKHFIDRGRKKLAFVGTHSLPYQERLKGFRQAMTDAGMTPSEKLLLAAGDESSYYSMISRIVKNGADALFIPGTSMQAVEGGHILQYVMGKKVPDEIAVIGSECERVSEFMMPPLTTIFEPLEDMAVVAAAMVQKLANGEKPDTLCRTLPVKLIERESV